MYGLLLVADENIFDQFGFGNDFVGSQQGVGDNIFGFCGRYVQGQVNRPFSAIAAVRCSVGTCRKYVQV